MQNSHFIEGQFFLPMPKQHDRSLQLLASLVPSGFKVNYCYWTKKFSDIISLLGCNSEEVEIIGIKNKCNKLQLFL